MKAVGLVLEGCKKVLEGCRTAAGLVLKLDGYKKG